MVFDPSEEEEEISNPANNKSNSNIFNAASASSSNNNNNNEKRKLISTTTPTPTLKPKTSVKMSSQTLIEKIGLKIFVILLCFVYLFLDIAIGFSRSMILATIPSDSGFSLSLDQLIIVLQFLFLLILSILGIVLSFSLSFVRFLISKNYFSPENRQRRQDQSLAQPDALLDAQDEELLQRRESTTVCERFFWASVHYLKLPICAAFLFWIFAWTQNFAFVYFAQPKEFNWSVNQFIIPVTMAIATVGFKISFSRFQYVSLALIALAIITYVSRTWYRFQTGQILTDSTTASVLGLICDFAGVLPMCIGTIVLEHATKVKSNVITIINNNNNNNSEGTKQQQQQRYRFRLSILLLILVTLEFVMQPFFLIFFDLSDGSLDTYFSQDFKCIILGDRDRNAPGSHRQGIKCEGMFKWFLILTVLSTVHKILFLVLLRYTTMNRRRKTKVKGKQHQQQDSESLERQRDSLVLKNQQQENENEDEEEEEEDRFESEEMPGPGSVTTLFITYLCTLPFVAFLHAFIVENPARTDYSFAFHLDLSKNWLNLQYWMQIFGMLISSLAFLIFVAFLNPVS